MTKKKYLQSLATLSLAVLVSLTFSTSAFSDTAAYGQCIQQCKSNEMYNNQRCTTVKGSGQKRDTLYQGFCSKYKLM